MNNLENVVYRERTTAYILSSLSLKKHINYFKLGVNEHVIMINVHDFFKTFMIYIFSMTFPGLEMTI